MESVLIGWVDLLLVPLYFILLLSIIKLVQKKQASNPLIQKYLVKAFLFKIFGGLIYALLVNYYWGFGDTASYFKEVLAIKKLLQEGRISVADIFTNDYSFFRENFDIVGSVNNSGFLVVKVAFLLSYIGFNSFLVCTMLVSTIALAGIFKLFETFVSFAPEWHFIIACFVLFFPSINIYGSGILKDTYCFSALGWLFYAFTNIRNNKNQISNAIIIMVAAYFIIVIKAYIIAAFAAALILVVCMNILNKIDNKALRILSLPIILVFFGLIIFLLQNQINEVLGVYSTEKLEEHALSFQKNYADLTENADSNFDIGEIEPNIQGMLKKMPVGMVATLYRPFIWEVRKPIMLLSALESIFLFVFSLYVIKKAGFLFFTKRIFSDPNVFLCVFFSIVFSGIVGITTFNFGTLSRYRIPVIPFYLMGFLLVLYQSKIILRKKQLEIEG